MEKKTPQKIIAIDTSTSLFQVALGEEIIFKTKNNLNSTYKIRSKVSYPLGMKHSEILQATCESLLKKCHWKLKDLNGIVVTTGPGSFTGLRVGISFCRALSQILNVPLMGVPNFEIILNNFLHHSKSKQKWGCILLPSTGQKVFCGVFKPGSLKPHIPYFVTEIQELIPSLKKVTRLSDFVFFGDGFRGFEIVLREKNRSLEGLSKKFDVPKIESLVSLGLKRMFSKKIESWEQIVPLYIRPPMAIERLTEKKRR